MTTPVDERAQPKLHTDTTRSSEEEGTFVTDGSNEHDPNRLAPHPAYEASFRNRSGSTSQTREEAHRLQDDLAMLQVERVVSDNNNDPRKSGEGNLSVRRTRSRRSEPVDEFDQATNPIHEKAALYKPPEQPSNSFSKLLKAIHQRSVIIRWFFYIIPLFAILLIPLLLGLFLFPRSGVGGVSLLWFSVWLEIVWLTLWAGRVVAKMIPWPLGLISSLFTNNSKKWRDLGKQLEIPATVFFWWLGVEISFLPTMKNHHLDGNKTTKNWETTMNKVIITIFVGACLNFVEKIIIQLIAISFHLRTYADRIDLNKFQIGSLTKLYSFSKEKIAMEDSEFEEKEPSGPGSGAMTPMQYADKAQKAAREAFSKVGDVAGTVAGDFTGRSVVKSNHPHQVVLALLRTTGGSQVLARRLYRTFVRDGFDTVFSGDLKSAFDNEEEAEAAFGMFDKDMNGDISMEELEAVCVEIGRERKSITASLKDLDSVVSKLDDVFFFIVIVITLLVLLSLISTSAAGVLTSAGSAVLALSWLFSATAQEFLQSVIFVFVKHPFDVGDRVSIYGNTGSTLKGDDYFVKEIALLYTEFKKMEGHIVQAPNSYLNTLFILNMRRSGGLAEAIPIVIRFGTTLDQIDALRQSLLEFVRSEKREYQGNILTELRDVTEAYSLTLNVVFFYKSNWQNELLRLQRRNKFICALMVAMQDIGIEGPYRNVPGARVERPYYVQYPGAPPTSQTQSNDRPDAFPPLSTHQQEPFVAPPSSVRNHPSILRNRGPSSTSYRPRGESVSTMAKRVDFSLGMKDVSSGDLMSDVYDQRSQSRVPDVVRAAEEREKRRISEADEKEADTEASRASGRSTSKDGGEAKLSGALRVRHSQDTDGRPSISSGTHRNRFLDRFGRGSRSRDGPPPGDDDLMEQGRLDPRTGVISTSAVAEDDPAPSSSWRMSRSFTENLGTKKLQHR
ncbi:MAG: hypothetical protein Q9160_004516 [Pyrenula sp. 1 TL-2023]